MEERVCKKCKKPLPDWYESDCCEACMNKLSGKIKTYAKTAGGILAVAFTVTVGVIKAVGSNKSKS